MPITSYRPVTLVIFTTLVCIASIFAFSFFASAQTIIDGDLVTTSGSFDIYIVKLVPSTSSLQGPEGPSGPRTAGQVEKKFKRLILNPDIFNSYGHLRWENVKTVSQSIIDEYTLSELVIEINPDGSIADPKVYRVTSAPNSDVGERRWLNISASEFDTAGYDWDSIYFINSTEASPDFYPTKTPLTYWDVLSEQPWRPTATDESAQISEKRSKSGDLITNVPACSGQRYTTSLISLDVLNDITPLGNVVPPTAHVLPTEHMYWHTIEFPSKKWTLDPLYAPGDIWITIVRSSPDDNPDRPTPGDGYGLHFSLCEDVHGYLYNVVELEPFILDAVKDVPCLDNWVGNICAREAQLFVKSGTLIGYTGGIGTHGIDFGTYDERQSPPYANLGRHRFKSRYIACPLDYFSDDLRPALDDKLPVNVNKSCGKVSHDIVGALVGNWYHEDVPMDEQGQPEQQLAFVHDAGNPQIAVISAGGKSGIRTGSSGRWFTATTSGVNNRAFKDVTPDGNIYCYQGTILVQMISETEILIEELIDPPLSPYGVTTCERIEHKFINPHTYRR